MEGLDPVDIESYVSITGVSKAIAIEKLEEHGGNITEAIDAYFIEGDRNINQEVSSANRRSDVMDVDDQMPIQCGRPPSSQSSFARDLNPPSLLEPNFTGSIVSSGSGISVWSPFVSQPRVVEGIPIEVKDVIGASGQVGGAPTIENIPKTAHDHGPEIRGTIITHDDDDKNAPITPAAGLGNQDSSTHSAPSAPTVVDVTDYGYDIEEEMIQAAIETSKHDAAMSNQQQFCDHLDLNAPTRPEEFQMEDAEFARAVSLSLQSDKQEKALRELNEKVGASGQEARRSATAEEMGKLSSSSGRKYRLEVGNSSIQDEAEDVEQLPLVRHRRRRMSSGFVDTTKDVEEVEFSPHSSSPQHDNNHHFQHNGTGTSSVEWGGISSEEHDEAVMLEAAMFGGIPEGSEYQFPYARHQLRQNGLDRAMGPYPRRIPRSPSPSLAVQRLIREQQDDEFLAALQADMEKELKAKEEAEAALAEARRVEEELWRKMQEEQETERQLAAKEASLPQEPTPDDENAVALLVRMPDGSRRGRRFLMSDKLQHLFDFIDVGRVVKSGSYRLVRPYPRCAFSNAENSSTLHELGLTNKQEALYLDLI